MHLVECIWGGETIDGVARESDAMQDSFREAIHQTTWETTEEAPGESSEKVRGHVAALIVRVTPRRGVYLPVDQGTGHRHGESPVPAGLDERNICAVGGQT